MISIPRFRLRTLLIVLAIGPPIVAIPYIRQLRREAVAKVSLATLDNAVKAYCLDVGQLPSSLEDLVSVPYALANPAKWQGPYLETSSVPLDPWGKPFGYRAVNSAQCTFSIWSNGSDAKPGTTDDITLRK